jgi:hypothetical protein
VFAMRARAFDLPARSFMNSSLRERQEAIAVSIQESINEAISD